MHIGSTHLSNVGKERSRPSTNEPVRAERGGRLHAESIRPRFYNLTTTSQERRPCGGFTTSSSLEEHGCGVDGLDHSTRSTQKPIQLPKDHSRAVFTSLFWRRPAQYYRLTNRQMLQLLQVKKKKKTCPMWGRAVNLKAASSSIFKILMWAQ